MTDQLQVSTAELWGGRVSAITCMSCGKCAFAGFDEMGPTGELPAVLREAGFCEPMISDAGLERPVLPQNSSGASAWSEQE